ncbi:MAG: DUF4163 domain-containing protein [Erythrobacter sp.]|uniref:DUF4163 domain-containing protein n=1 Tax=Erythrobacter sp. TaxID=1042 RepID=UPI00260359D4|nr:DUF4163 domain-containing protein [Erythrobacter sp.]MDJ0979888.1 DUF4163 domain-containing protein [Erythrobacter sp.]
MATRILIATSALAALAACSSSEEMNSEINAASANAAAIPDDAGEKREILVENAAFNFSYAWPAQVVAIPAFNTAFEARAITAREEFEAMAREAQAEAEQYGYPYRVFQTTWEWKLVGDTPLLLSLVGENYAYTGGAHGNSFFMTTVWDKEASVELAALDLFTSPAAFDAATRAQFCAQLAEERGRKLGGADVSGDCPPLGDLAVALISSQGETIDAVQFLAAPYVAGSYAEGSYVITLDVSEDLLEAVRPAYQSAFAGSG